MVTACYRRAWGVWKMWVVETVIENRGVRFGNDALLQRYTSDQIMQTSRRCASVHFKSWKGRGRTGGHERAGAEGRE